MDVTLAASVDEFFHEVVTDALSAVDLDASEPASWYLVGLLGDFTKARLTDEPLGLKLAQPVDDPGERVRTLKQVGDTSLYVAGFFAESLNRSLVDVDYYVGIGQHAYAQLARSLGVGKAITEVYEELAAKFPRFVDVLMAVRRRVAIAELNATTDIGKLYEVWLRTRDEWVEKKLKRRRDLGRSREQGDPVVRRSTPLRRVQRGLEALYRVETGVEVDDFVFGARRRDELAPTRKAREQLLVVEAEGEMNLALFLEPSVLANLDDPRSGPPARRSQPRRLPARGRGRLALHLYGVLRAGRAPGQPARARAAGRGRQVRDLPARDRARQGQLRGAASPAVRRGRVRGGSRSRRAAIATGPRTTTPTATRPGSRTRSCRAAGSPRCSSELRRFYRQGLSVKLSTIARAA